MYAEKRECGSYPGTANTRGLAITAMAAHVGGSAESSKKRSHGGAKRSDPEKIETL